MATIKLDRLMNQKLDAAIESVKLYCDGVNSSDAELISQSMHFPHYRIQIDGSVLVWNTETEYLTSFNERTSEAGWAYSTVDSIKGEVIGDYKCHITARFSRYRKDASLIAEVAALYVVIYKDDRWGMNAGSVLTPA